MLNDKVTSEIVKVFVDDGFAEEASEAGPGVGKDVAVDEPVQPPAELLVLEHVGQHMGLVVVHIARDAGAIRRGLGAFLYHPPLHLLPYLN